MTDGNDQDEAKTRMSLRPTGRTDVGRTVDGGSVRQSFSHGRSKVVQVEVRKKRPTLTMPGSTSAPGPAHPGVPAGPPSGAPAGVPGSNPVARGPGGGSAPTTTTLRPGSAPARAPAGAGRALTAAELASRQRAIEQMQRDNARREAEHREQEKISILSAAEEARRREEDARRAAEEAARRAADEAREKAAEEAARRAAEAAPVPPPPGGSEARRPARPAPAAPISPTETLRLRARTGEEEDEARRVRRPGSPMLPARKPPVAAPKKGVDDRRGGRRIDVQAAIEGEDERVRSLASVRRQRERERRQQELELLRADGLKVVRDVVLPETITVSELANRMAARAAPT